MWERRGVYRVLVWKPDKDHLEDPDVDGRIIFRWIFKLGCGGTEWIKLGQVWDWWRAFVNAVMNLRVP
jgi:hypothetical protein